MNAIEKRISTTFAPGILTEIREELNGLKGKISQKNWDRMNGTLRARSRFLARGGAAEETVEESQPGLPPAKAGRRVKWIQITRTDGEGRIYLDGWRRSKGSRKSHIRKMLKEPRLLYDPTKAKKDGGKKKPKKVVIKKTAAVGKSTTL